MALKYRGLVQRYSTDRRVNRGSSSKHDRMNVVGEPPREVRRRDAAICEWLGPPSDDNKKDILGYLTTFGIGDTIFGAEKSRLVSTAGVYARHGFNSNVLYHLSKLTQGSFTS